MRDFILKAKIFLSLFDVAVSGDFILGPHVRKFEERFKDYVGVKYALGVANGTDALILALKACSIGPGDEVLVPAFGFVSTAAAVAWINAKPVFVDVSRSDFNIDVSKIERAISEKTKAIIPVHLNGRPADMDAVMAIAKRHGLFVIVDAAHAIGSKYKGKSVAGYGDVVCFSFNPTKLLGGYGDGGAIVTDNSALAEKVSLMRMYGAPDWNEIHFNNKIIGVASRLDSFQASVLDKKLDYIDSWIEKRRENLRIYRESLKGVGCIYFSKEDKDCFENGYRFLINTPKRDELKNFLCNKRGLSVHPYYPIPLPYLPAFSYLRYKRGDFSEAEKIANEALVLPTNHILSKTEIIRIANLVKIFFATSGI